MSRKIAYHNSNLHNSTYGVSMGKSADELMMEDAAMRVGRMQLQQALESRNLRSSKAEKISKANPLIYDPDGENPATVLSYDINTSEFIARKTHATIVAINSRQTYYDDMRISIDAFVDNILEGKKRKKQAKKATKAVAAAARSRLGLAANATNNQVKRAARAKIKTQNPKGLMGRLRNMLFRKGDKRNLEEARRIAHQVMEEQGYIPGPGEKDYRVPGKAAFDFPNNNNNVSLYSENENSARKNAFIAAKAASKAASNMNALRLNMPSGKQNNNNSVARALALPEAPTSNLSLSNADKNPVLARYAGGRKSRRRRRKNRKKTHKRQKKNKRKTHKKKKSKNKRRTKRR